MRKADEYVPEERQYDGGLLLVKVDRLASYRAVFFTPATGCEDRLSGWCERAKNMLISHLGSRFTDAGEAREDGRGKSV